MAGDRAGHDSGERTSAGTSAVVDSLPVNPFHRAIALPAHRVVFVPVPKTGCTTIMWHLAEEVLGVGPRRFRGAMAVEVTAAMTIHSRRHWPDEAILTPGELLRTVQEGWAWVTVVRDPYRRLWSAWQSKILLHEPYFAKRFGREPWYPREIGSAAAIRDAFRAFVRTQAGETRPHDLHWASQWDFLRPDVIPYVHIGRTERLQATIDLLRRTCAVEDTTAQPRIDNRMPLPYEPSLFDDECREIAQERYGQDCDAFGYPTAIPAGDPDGWESAVDPVVPAIRLIRERTERIRTLQQQARQLRRNLRAARAEAGARADGDGASEGPGASREAQA